MLAQAAAGQPLHRIAADNNMSPKEVRKILSAAISTYNAGADEHAEYVYLVNYLRLENMLEQSMDAAFGSDLRSETERRWGQLALNIIKEQNAMAANQLKWAAPDTEEKNSSVTNIYAPTIVAGDDMFYTAQKSLNERGKDFFSEHAGKLPGALEGEVVSIALEDPRQAQPAKSRQLPGMEAIEKKLKKLEEELHGTGNDGEDGDEGEG